MINKGSIVYTILNALNLHYVLHNVKCIKFTLYIIECKTKHVFIVYHVWMKFAREKREGGSTHFSVENRIQTSQVTFEFILGKLA